jgi:phosphatidylglycerol:prolipoprotein diacylglycerol transferase
VLVHPQFDPVALKLGPVAIHWYGLMYLAGFAAFMLLGRLRVRHQPFARHGWTTAHVDDLLFYGVLGVIVGGRLGYVLFYKPLDYLANPLEIFAVWKGGMSFHGGLLGVVAAEWWYARKIGRPLFEVADFVAPLVPLGLGFGRLANFINGELWGRPTDLPWAMVFPQAGDRLARHPSQIYQLLIEGVVLFAVVWLYARRERKPGAVAGMFLLVYGLGRFAVEFAREPDRFLGTLALGLSMGQWLCVPMIALGLWLLLRPLPPLGSAPGREARKRANLGIDASGTGGTAR